MRKAYALLLVALLGLTGCAKVNPRIDEKIDNQNGKIGEIRNNQNGIMAEIGKLQQQTNQNGSTLKDVQQGYLNLQNKLLSNENSGVQILQGDGPLIMLFGLGVIAMVLYHYRNQSILAQKSADILAQQIAHYNDPELNDRVFQAAMHTTVEGNVYKLIKKYKAR